ncbi:hypothetical protein BGX21_011656 [Mortierella sp. AD011]|nr:hypothetical protein BGX20_000531 [Mortierella sp. AD010]KAF9389603.1 hypothetical protein BGX21_011656 [Mortierella sp. AD011]
MSLPASAIDQEQLDQRLTKLIMDHNNYRTLLFRYIRRSLALCNWYIDQDCPSFFRQFDRTDKLASLVLYIRDHALQSFQALDRNGSALLNQVDILLARSSIPVTNTSPLAEGMSPTRTHPGSRNISALNTLHDQSNHRLHIHDNPNGSIPRSGPAFNNNRLLFLAGEVKEAIRFWREQCLCAQSMEPKIFEMDRISEMRYLALTGDGSTIEEKARAIRISCEQARLVTDEVEPFMDQWLGKLSVLDRPKEELQGYGQNHPLVGSVALGGVPPAGHLHHTASHNLNSPSYSSHPWGQGAS